MTQYPYTLEVLYLTGGGKDVNGNPIPPIENWVALTRCRDEDGKSKVITTPDGVQHQFAFLVQMPQGVEPLKSGAKVRVKEGNEIRAIGDVIYSRKDQFHSRLWV